MTGWLLKRSLQAKNSSMSILNAEALCRDRLPLNIRVSSLMELCTTNATSMQAVCPRTKISHDWHLNPLPF